MSLKRWLKRRQHLVGVRQALDLTQSAYGVARRLLADDDPALAGGWPTRLVPLPPPRPITGPERRALRRAGRLQGTSFFDADSVREFERRLAERWGARHALAVSSGTAALHTALMACGIGPGDEVVVPVMTYVATALAVMQAGAVPRFVDADPQTWNIDPAGVEAVVNERTKAVIPVHMGGVPCDMHALRAIAERHGLRIIEDAAHAHGSTLEGRWLGTWGDVGCFSFGSPKTMTTGEGGMLLTDDPELFRRARMAMNLGECTPDGQPTLEIDHFSPEARLDYRMVGWNYRMSVAQASLGLGQLARLERIRAARRRNAAHLREALATVEGIALQRVPAGAEPCYYTFPTALDERASLGRGELLQGLAREKIDFRLWSNLPLAAHDVFGQPGSFPVAERLCAGFVGLRVDPALGPREMRSTVEALRRLLDWGRRRAPTPPPMA
jgi:dTDP-4-amino-4,6-dideoxygalactose transaminase